MTIERLIELYKMQNERAKTAYENRVLCEKQLSEYRKEAISVSSSIYSECIEKGFDDKEAHYQSMSYYDSTMNSYENLYDELGYWEKAHTLALDMKEAITMAIIECKRRDSNS